jgi:hypothetical protein
VRKPDGGGDLAVEVLVEDAAHQGRFSMPYDSGQSGRRAPIPVLVTSPPQKMRKSVAASTPAAKRCRRRRSTCAEAATSP